MAITITQGRPVKSHNGQPYSTRIMGKTIPLIDLKWSELTKGEQHAVMHGDACGHPSNRPKSISEARKWIYTVRTDTDKIHGYNPGWSLSF